MSFYNSLSNELFLKTYRLRIPLFSIFELTYRCNLYCKHCYIPEQLRKTKELSIEKLKQTIYEISLLGGLYIVFTGGEPLLREEIFNLLKFAKKLNFVVILFSNGVMITQNVAKKLKHVGVDRVEISIYGPENVHNKFVGGKVFARTISAVEHLKKYGVDVCLKTILMNFNFIHYEYIKTLAEKLNVKLKVDYVVTVRNNGDCSPLKLQLDNEQMKFLLSQHKMSFNEPTTKPKTVESLTCSAGYNIVGITPDGKVYPCIQFPYKLGDLNKEKFIQIWQNNKFLSQIKDEKKYIKCFSCNLINFCNRCPGLCFIETRSLYGCSKEAKTLALTVKKLYENVM